MTDSMRILLLTRSMPIHGPGGMERHTMSLAKGLYSQCGISPMPTKCKEGMPLTVIEAMASGAVPFVPDNHLFREIVPEGGGFHIPLGNIKAWVDAITLCMERGDILTEMGRRARAYAVQNYDLWVMVKNTVEFYKEVLSSS